MPFDFDDISIDTAATPRATKSVASEAFLAARATSALPVYVDVGSRKIDSKVERDGVPITAVELDDSILKDFILDRPVLQVRVVQQSVPPGTPVPVGTTVNLVMAPPGPLPLGIVSGVHTGLRELSIADAYERVVGDNLLVNRIVTHAAAGQLSVEDKAAVVEIFSGVEGGEIVDEPGKDLNAAIETLKVLKTFGG